MSEPSHGRHWLWRGLGRLTTHHPMIVLAVALGIGVASIASMSRLESVGSIHSMMGKKEPSARALHFIAERFGGMEERIILVSIPDDRTGETVEARHGAMEDLLAYADRLIAAINDDPATAAMCRQVFYRPPPDMRRYVEDVIVPNVLYYLSDTTLDELETQLEPEAMRRRLRRTEEMLTAPGAGGALSKRMLRDPLALREFVIDSLPKFETSIGDMFGSSEGFFSADGRHLMIRLRGVRPASDLEFADAFSEAIRVKAEAVNTDGLELAYSGAYAIAARSQQAIRSDMIRSIVLSFIFLQVLYAVVYRNLWILPTALAPVALGILVGFGLFAELGRSLTPITAVIGAVLAGLGIDYCIHSLAHYRADRAEGLDHEGATRRTLRDITPALMAACVTTVVGFLAIAQSSVQTLRDFGLLGAMGLLASLITAVVVLPAIITVLVTRWRGASIPKSAAAGVTSDLLRHAVTHRGWFLTLGALAAVSGLVFDFGRSDTWTLFEDDLTVMHPRPNRPIEVQNRIAELFEVSPDALLIYHEAESTKAVTVQAHRAQDRLRALGEEYPVVVGSYGLASLLPDPRAIETRRSRIARVDADIVIGDFDAALDDSALNPAAFDDYRGFLKRVLEPGDPPTVADVLHYPGLARSVLPVQGEGDAAAPREALTAVLTGKMLRERASRDEAILAVRDALEGLQGATLTSLTVLGFDAERAMRRDLKKLLSLAAGVVLLWLLIYFRSLRGALLSLIPGAFGFLVMLAFMKIFDLKLNFMNMIAMPLLVGIGVDDGIFLVTIERRGRARGLDYNAIVTRLASGCHAILMTSLTTMLTIGTLIFTSTPAIRSIGIIMSLGVGAALVGAIWILAPLLIALEHLEDEAAPDDPQHAD